MAYSSRDTSPDPIVLPSSPIVPYSERKVRARRISYKSPGRLLSSPTKPATRPGPKDASRSPERFQITVDAGSGESSEYETASPVGPAPLSEFGGLRRSPAKRSYADSIEWAEIDGLPGKRKSPPLLRQSAQRELHRESIPSLEVDEDIGLAPVSPLRQPPRRRSRLSALPSNSHRSAQLSIARDELDQALQDAIGDELLDRPETAPGEMTVSANEDFSMVSVESLQAVKDNSMSHMARKSGNADLSSSRGLGGPSSPRIAQYPNISQQSVKAVASLSARSYDAMSWKPTGALNILSSPSAMKSDPLTGNTEPAAFTERRSPMNDESDRSPSAGVSHSSEDELANNLQQPTTAEDDDIWQEEASRSLNENNARSMTNIKTGLAQPDSPHFQDLLAGESLKPLRSKIPRAWRTTSGKDFSYVDSPANSTVSHKQSGEHTDESGVLTPPGTDEDVHGTEDGGKSLDHRADRSELSTPDTVASGQQTLTSLAHDQLQSIHAQASSEDSQSSSDHDGEVFNPDDEDTGLFWQQSVPHVYQPRWRRPPPRKEETVELTRLLNLDGANDPTNHGALQSEEEVLSVPTRFSFPRTARPITSSRAQDSEGRVFTTHPQATVTKSPPRWKSFRDSNKSRSMAPDRESSRSISPPNRTFNHEEQLSSQLSPDDEGTEEHISPKKFSELTLGSSDDDQDGDVETESSEISSSADEKSTDRDYDEEIDDEEVNALYTDGVDRIETFRNDDGIDSSHSDDAIDTSHSDDGVNTPHSDDGIDPSIINDGIEASQTFRKLDDLDFGSSDDSQDTDYEDSDRWDSLEEYSIISDEDESIKDEEINALRKSDEEELDAARSNEGINTPTPFETLEEVNNLKSGTSSDDSQDDDYEDSDRLDSFDEEATGEAVNDEEVNALYMDDDDAMDASKTAQGFDTSEDTNGVDASKISQDYDAFASYEEDLNLESPQKVRVKFNDSELNSHLLIPSRNYPPLFDLPPKKRPAELDRADGLKPKRARFHYPCTTDMTDEGFPAAEPSLYQRLASSVWSTFVLPFGPTEVPSLDQDPIQFPAALGTALRERYGVVSDEFPFTRLQVRILHRMLNSLTVGMPGSYIPSSGPLPICLDRLVDTTVKSICGWPYRFTKVHAYVAFSFFQVMVPSAVVEAMQVEFPGDSRTQQHRGDFGDYGRGDQPMTAGLEYHEHQMRWIKGQKGNIGVSFVVALLGELVWSNQERAKEGHPLELPKNAHRRLED